MCCVAKSDIPRVVRYTLDNAPTTETILIEASGLSDPDPVRDVLQDGELTSLVRLDTIVCIVDAENFEKTKDSHPIIISQIGDADIVIISKAGRLAPADVTRIKDIISNIGMGTKVLLWDVTLNPLLFLDSKIEKANIPSDNHEHIHETIDEYWYISDKPLDAQKLHPMFSSFSSNIIRAKGYSVGVEGKLLIQFVGSKLELTYSDSSEDVDHTTAILFLGNHLETESIQSALDVCRIM